MKITRTRVVRTGIKAVVAVAGVSLVIGLGAMPSLAQLPTIIDLDVPFGTESSPVTRILGDDAGDRLGSENSGLAFGDVDGDGFDDVIAGAPAAGPPGVIHIGEVYVIYGGASLPGTTVDLNSAVGSNGETRILGDRPSDTGWSVAAGDVDGDGFDDVIIGAPFADLPGRDHVGEVYVIYGSASLPGTTVDLNSAPGSNGETRILGADFFDQTGISVAAGDVDGDGFDDVIIGASRADAPSVDFAGVVYVIYGSASLRGTTVDLHDAPGSNDETRILGRDGPLTDTGFSVATGDVDGDGFDDVIVGAHYATTLGGTHAGEVYVIYGSASLRGKTVDLNSAPGSNGETRILGDDAGDWAGRSLAAGDVDGDGFDDVIIGVLHAGPPTGEHVGEAYVIYGNASLPGTTVDLNSAPGSNGETRILADDADGHAGWSVASSDVDGDGLDDVIIGAPLANPPGGGKAGEVYVIYGSATLPGTTVDLNSEVGANAETRVLGDNPEDRLGHAAAAGGDLDRDGWADFTASSWAGNNPSIGGANSTGTVALVFGAGSAVSATVVERDRPGDAPPRAFGGRLTPVVRTIVDYASGGPGVSTTRVTLHRSAPATPPPFPTVLPVYWEITTDRTGFSADLTLQYTDAELGASFESSLAVYSSTTDASGTWSLAGTSQSIDTIRNEITVFGLTDFSFFAIAAVETPLPAAAPHHIRKNRFISFRLDTASDTVAIRVELLDQACSLNGGTCTVDDDCRVCVGGDNNGLGCSIDSECLGGGTCTASGETCDELSPPVMLGWVSEPFTPSPASQAPKGIVVTRVQEEMPELRAWSEPVIHITDCEIAPVQSYALSTTTDGVNFSERFRVGTAKQPFGKSWADLVGTVANGVFTPPNGIINVNDLAALLAFFQGKVTGDLELIVTVLELSPEVPSLVISASDLGEWLRAFAGGQYPPPSFPTRGGPADCP